MVSSCLHEIFEAQVRERPEDLALISGETKLSYLELDRRANRFARHLRAQGAGPGKFIGIYFERSADPIIAILACLKSGAAYVPIDPSYPGERIRAILEESEAVLLLTESALSEKARASSPATVVVLEEHSDRIATCEAGPLSRSETGVRPEDLCYVIYTSGTTGRPKGIMTEHHNVVKFVDAFNEVCKTSPGERVFQGFSLTFDGSVEEIWMAFSNGSTLLVPTRETARFGNDLAKYLAENQVAYFSTVPTLLATFTESIPAMRLLVVSGEVCPPELVNRWAKPELRMLNVYGPTEATVNTTAFECVPGRPITIGKPLRGYGIHILDSEMRPVAPGEKGELYVSGETLARGYLKQPELTAERFFTIPGVRLYRTGDQVRLGPGEELEFFGRLDGQVKIRGFRVELAEIEAVLMEEERVRSASVRLVEKNGLQEIAAYVILSESAKALDRAVLLSNLEARLPPYMVPGFLDELSEFPRLTSGKVNRAQLPEPVSPLLRAATKIVPPATELEKKIAGIWSGIFSLPEVSVEDDFFLNLGGHSLLAAQMATLVRKVTGKHATVRDAYGFPTIRALAAHLEKAESGEASIDSSGPSAKAVFESVPRATRFSVVALQVASMFLFMGVFTIPFALLFLPALGWLKGSTSLMTVFWVWLALILVMWPLMLGISITAKWLIIGRYKPAAYPLWSFGHFRHWIAGKLQSLSGAGMLVGTPMLPVYMRIMGARVGKRCQLDTAAFGSWDLISIGDDTSIGADTQMPGYRVENGLILVGGAEIGSRCFVGIHSAIGLGARMEDDSRLDDQSFLPDGEVIPRGEGRRGSPAQAVEVPVPGGESGARHPVLMSCAQLALIFLMPLLSLIPLIPFLAFWYFSFADGGILIGALALLVSVPLGVIVTALFIAGLKRMVLNRAEPGTYSIDSVFYLRKWLSDGIMKASRGILLPLYTTLYFPPWLRIMGAKIGARAELSTVWSFSPELVDVGEESFFADGSIIGGKRFFGGRFEISRNRIGRRSFVGNSAILPVGSSLGDRCLLGVQSIPPSGVRCTQDGTEWLGSPSFALPHRPKVGNFNDSVTFKPTRKLYAQRALIDALRILIPGYIGIALLVADVLGMYFFYVRFGAAVMLMVSPIQGLALAIVAMLLVVALKKAVMGTFKPVIVPLWSMYVWLNEMVNGAYESVMAPAIAPFLGTPFAAPLLRLIGCRIGKHTYIETALFSEFDLVEIGDYAALNAGAIIQNHLFEDRIMKSSYLKVGPECSVGNMAVVLYDSEMLRGSSIGPLSLLMKGDTLAARTAWHGIPTVRAKFSSRKLFQDAVVPVPLRTDFSVEMPIPMEAQ